MYVAMTRAKKFLCMFVPPVVTESSAMALDQIVREQLVAYGAQPNDREWFEELKTASGEPANLLFSLGSRAFIPAVELTPAPATTAPRRFSREIPAFTPTGFFRASDAATHILAPSKRFAPSVGTAVGTLVHGLMEKITRLPDDFDPDAFAAANLPDVPGADAAAKIFVRALRADSNIRKLLTDIPAGCEILNECGFLRKSDDHTVVPGVFDRVVLHRSEGNVVRVEVFDWKSDDLDSPEKFGIYSGQLAAYRTALARMYRLPESSVAAAICALKLDAVIRV